MLEYIILGILHGGPLTGYEIKKYIDGGVAVFYKASYGSMYPLLKRLTEKNYVTMTEQNQGSRNKKYYEMTKEGQKAFYDWLSEPIPGSEGMDQKLVKIYFYDQLNTKKREELLSIYQKNCEGYRDKLYELEKKFREAQTPDCFYYKLSTLYYGIRVIEDTIQWCEHIKEHKPLGELIKRETK